VGSLQQLRDEGHHTAEDTKSSDQYDGTDEEELKAVAA
jgi:hypothetical protein